MKPHIELRRNVTSLIGVLLCGWSAVLLCYLFPEQQWKSAIPIVFLGIVLLVATRCGVAAGVLGSILAALIFAYFLYQPIGSVTVTSKEAREKLAWMLLGGLVLSFLLGGFKSGGEHRSS